MKKISKSLLVIILTLMLSMLGCSEEKTLEGENTKIRLGVMSAADSAPILLAEEKGYFEELGIDVEIEIFTNGATKQSSIQAGELDGAMLSIIQFLNNVNGGLKAKITTTTDGIFPVVLSKDFTEKKDVKVGLMEISVINYLADKYLSDYNVEKVYINEMPLRIQALMENQIDMAVLPEPLASNAEAKGLEKRVYGKPDDYTPNAIIFTDEFINKNPNTVEAFHKGYNKAVDEINKNPELSKDILIDELDLDPQIKNLIVLPTYHKCRVPDEAYLTEIKEWTEKLQGSDLSLNYDYIVTDKFTK